MKIKVAFVSLGCPKNLVDTERMLARLLDHGAFELVPEDIDADVVIINTCAFIQSAKEESIEAVLDVAWLKENRGLKGIVVTGCMAQRYSRQIQTELPEVDAILGLGDEDKIADAVQSAYRGRPYCSVGAAEALALEGDRVIVTPEYTAYLKIAEGCDNRCAYCAIPSIRGGFRSRRMEDILAEAKTLYELGARELCLIAQDTTRYGLDLYGEYKLAALLERLASSEEFRFSWIRLLYCYPDKITEELADVIARYDTVAKYIDMPIQHISEPVLSAMNRRGGEKAIRDAVRLLRERVPGIVLRTTVLVGFPGETERDFARLSAFLKETRFDRLGVFAFSREEGTPAYAMKGTVPRKIREKRVDILMNEQYTVHEEKNRDRIGQTVTVLCEGYDPVAESYYGRSEADAPEIDGKVHFSSGRAVSPGEFLQVKITEALDYDLIGEALPA